MKKRNSDANRQSYILTRETLGMTILLFCAIVLIMLFTNKWVFSGIGAAVCTFMYGTFGYGSFLVVAALAYLGEWLVFEKKINFNLKTFAVTAACIIAFFLLFHAVSTKDFSLSAYGGYLADSYLSAEKGYAGYTFGGVISGLLVYPVAKGTTFVGAYVIFSVLFALCAYLAFTVIRNSLISKELAGHKSKIRVPVSDNANADPLVEGGKASDRLYSETDEYEIVNNSRPSDMRMTESTVSENSSDNGDKFQDKDLGRKILFENGEFAAESYRRNMIFNQDSYFNHPVHNDGDYLNSFSSGKTNSTPSSGTTYSESYSEEVESSSQPPVSPSYVYGEKPVEDFGDYVTDSGSVYGYGSPERDNDAALGYDRMIRDDAQSAANEGRGILNDYGNGYDSDYSYAERNNYTADVSRERESAENIERASQNNAFEENISESTDFGQLRRTSEELGDSSDNDNGNSLYSLFGASNPRSSTGRVEPDVSRLSSRRQDRANADIFDDDEPLSDDSDPVLGTRGLRNYSQSSEDYSEEETRSTESGSVFGPIAQRNGPVSQFGQGEKRIAPESAEPAKEDASVQEKPKHVWKKYVRPTLDLLDDYPENNNVNTAEIEDSKNIIVETLENFRIASHIANVTVGPAITRYDVIIEDKTNIKNALKYREAIAMSLMKENVNAYLNYSKGAISIEVPNAQRTTIGLKGMLASSKFINCKPNTLTFALGKNVDGEVICPDITKMPHLLVAGTTGSGKSICLSSLIVSLLYKYGPEELRFILVDPKQAEFIPYDKLPHLMINEIIYDVDKAIKALNWAIKEMERRYTLFKEMSEKGVLTKNLTEYNSHLPEGEEKLPKIVVILDEFGDLMMAAKKDIETRIIRLVQKSRACGIHLILATQRPSVDCITGLIKSNLPTRIGFKVNSFDDSRTIFDIGGAEKLLGRGDMYFRSAENPDLARIQGCFIDSPEVQRVTDFVKKNNETYFDQSVSDFINTVEEPPVESNDGDGTADSETKIDDKFIAALKFCVESNQASVSMIQRRFPVGYVKACKIIDWMENMNYITQSEGSKPRKVLLSLDEFKRIYGDVDD